MTRVGEAVFRASEVQVKECLNGPPGGQPKQPVRKTASVEVDEFLTELRAKAQEQLPSSKGKTGSATSPMLVLPVSLLLFGVSPTVSAQQTIFNVPSSDVLDKGKVYFELDVTFKPNRDSDNVVTRFSSFVPRLVVGTGGRVEVGLNITGNIQPGPDATTLVPAIKWKAYDGGDNGWAFVVGDHLFIPVHNRSYDAGNYVYAQVSKTLKTKTRLTAGLHHFSPDVVHPENKAGGQFGFEQPINSKFGVAADWFSHKSATGYGTAGVNFKPHPKVTGYAAYSIANENATRGNHFFYVALGINFN